MISARTILIGSVLAVLAIAAVMAIALIQRNQLAAEEISKVTAPPGFVAIETPGGIFYRRLDVDSRLEGVSQPAFEKALKIVR